jgi:protein gp37
MAKNSKIEWTHHTFNPWWGCTKVSPACDHCYAETWAKRTGHSLWGARAKRRFFGDEHWRKPLRWDDAAAAEGLRARVFCASMGDVFEWGKQLSPWRQRLWELIESTPNLDWLLLTKRPHLVMRLVPWREPWPANVWIGITAENQRFLDKRLPHLMEIPSQYRFLSCEPLLSPLDISEYAAEVDWIIAGGESGRHARKTDPNWVRSLRDQCIEYEIGFHFKQWGDWFPIDGPCRGTQYARVGKKRAGRSLDGREWDELPRGYNYRSVSQDQSAVQ